MGRMFAGGRALGTGEGGGGRWCDGLCEGCCGCRCFVCMYVCMYVCVCVCVCVCVYKGYKYAILEVVSRLDQWVRISDSYSEGPSYVLFPTGPNSLDWKCSTKLLSQHLLQLAVAEHSPR